MRVANNPDARLNEQMMAELYLNHPYGRPVIGWHHEIEKLNREDALAFYRRFYAPNNATLIVAGDVEPNDVHAMAERTFGKVAPQPLIPAHRVRPQEPEPAAPRTVTLADPNVRQPELKRYYLVPSAATTSPQESAALDVLAQVMGSGTNSYLYRALVVDHPLAVNATAGYQGTAIDPSQFKIAAAPKPGIGFPQVEQAIDAVIAKLKTDLVPAEQLERAKTQLVAQAVYAQDSQVTLARWYGAALTVGLSVEDIRAWPDRVHAVTAEQVRTAARKWFDKKRSVTGYLIKEAAPAAEEKRS
jgi:zinc protease